MPPRRSSMRGTPIPSPTTSETPRPASGRLTRSALSKNQTVSTSEEPQSASSLASSRPRGRPKKASLGIDEPLVSATPSVKRRGRPSKVSGLISESASPGPSLMEGLSDTDYSTPATSKLPTPAATDLNKSTSSFEVQIPGPSSRPDRERGLRKSIYSMNSSSKGKGKTTEILDSEEEEELEAALLASRLEGHKRTKAANSPSVLAPTVRRSARVSGPALSPAVGSGPSKRRALDLPPDERSTKRPKVIADSEDSEGLDIDANSDIAGPASSKSQTDYLSSAQDDSDDEVPLAKRSLKRRSVPAPAARGRRTIVPLTARSAARAPLGPPSNPPDLPDLDTDETDDSEMSLLGLLESTDDSDIEEVDAVRRIASERRAYRPQGTSRRVMKERERLEKNHPEIITMWDELESMPVLKAGKADQPSTISRQLKPFQLEGLAWMKQMEETKWKGGLLGDEMGLGKTIQAVSLIMSDYPAKQPSLVLVPPVALMQWQSEIKSYTDGTLKTFVYHGTNQKAKNMTAKDLKKFDVIMMSYNSLESMYRKQEKGFRRKNGIYKEKSVIHSISFHRIILDEAHCIKTRTTMTAKACFALKTNFRWCLTGTPLQNRIGEFFSLIRFLNIRPFASYLCKQCPCSMLEWDMNVDNRCSGCNHAGMQHVSVFNQELLTPILKFGNLGPGREAFRKLRLMTDRIMLRRLKKNHTNSMELPVKEVYVDRQFFGEEENDFANSIMTSGQRRFDTYVAQGVLLNNYANIFGLIMQMRQVADHPDLILKKNADGGQNILVCCICDEPSEDTVRSRCKHDFCRACVSSYVRSTADPDCPRCHIPLAIDLEQPEIEQDENLMKKNSIINRIKMENWTSSSKIELLVHELHKLRSDHATHKSIIFSQFTTMLQLIEWRLRRAGITTVMLDGSMTPAQRQASIEHFMNNVDVECFLVSLKAGGVALNLTEASRVFIVDPWWNPAAEWQSADRCHRIGQTRPCTITRLCIEDSVESRMVLIQEKKTNMIHSTVNADDKAMDSLSPEDMQFLFRGH